MGFVTIHTSKFGTIEVEEDSILTFVKPILGFDNLHRYILLKHQEDSPFEWLQSTEKEELTFVVTNPALFGINYEFEIPDQVLETLNIQSVEDVLVFTLVTIPHDNPSHMTANLIAPVIVNHQSRKAIQWVLENSGFNVKTRLLPDYVLQDTASSSTDDTCETSSLQPSSEKG